MIRAHKIRLYPNNKQETYFRKASGVSRFAYNWGLSEWKRRYEAGEKVSEAIIRKQLNRIKRTEFPWMLEVTKCAVQLAIKNDLNSAFKNFFAGKAGYPKFHKKGIHDRFSISNDQFKVKGKSVKIPNLGWVRLAEEPRFKGKILNGTISRTADKWFIAIQFEIEEASESTAPGSENQAVGVDLGVKSLATLSDGRRIEGSKATRSNEKKLKRLNQALSRKKGGKKGEKRSKNFEKTKNKISRLYAKMANIRADETHKLTSMLITSYNIIGIEDLNVKGMMKNHTLAKSIADMSFFELRRQLEYKAEPRGVKIVVADRFFPSSKTCSCCGYKNDSLSLSDRKWVCPNCNESLDRDVNAAINLREYAVNKVS